ncbi:unnamed protein product [Bursaphelenchus xylophilus]|uniref:(pine wood nematode) hypothetical protein n=1 Tax=Bursaphelenchus xylophilus TaxID=6326 RepID=A0A1I7RWL1_BURXY|nr:unnamed protein product [Bursaphelenchus xylophilus]CAG9128468.1 unnamed protein product [Bursaphelenchus xylophilus]
MGRRGFCVRAGGAPFIGPALRPIGPLSLFAETKRRRASGQAARPPTKQSSPPGCETFLPRPFLPFSEKKRGLVNGEAEAGDGGRGGIEWHIVLRAYGRGMDGKWGKRGEE